MTDIREMGDYQKRSDEMILVGYFLSRCTDFSDVNVPRPPVALNVDSWNETYDLFFDRLSDGRSRQQFRHTLRNTRDIFDSLFNNGRKGWSDEQKRGVEFSDRDRAVCKHWKNRSAEELTEYVLGVTAIKAGPAPDRRSQSAVSGNALNSVTGSFSPVYEVALDPAEADWVPPSDLPSEYEIRLVQSGGNSIRLARYEAVFAMMGTPVSELSRRARKIEKDERGMHSDRIRSALEKIIDDLEGEIAHLNAEGAKLFGLSQYEDATKIAELGRKLQTFRHKVSELRSDWNEVSGTTPILSEAEVHETTGDPSASRRKSRKKSLVVTMDDGRAISGRTAAETFTKTIVGMGIEQVKGLGLEVNREPLISDIQSERYNTANIDGQYVMTQTSTSKKKELLTRIANELGVEINVEVSD